MKPLNIKNLSNKKIAIDCSSWEESKQVTHIIKRPDMAIIDCWVSTTPFLCLLPGMVTIAWRTHYWAKENGFAIIPADQFIADNQPEEKLDNSMYFDCNLYHPIVLHQVLTRFPDPVDFISTTSMQRKIYADGIILGMDFYEKVSENATNQPEQEASLDPVDKTMEFAKWVDNLWLTMDSLWIDNNGYDSAMQRLYNIFINIKK